MLFNFWPPLKKHEELVLIINELPSGLHIVKYKMYFRQIHNVLPVFSLLKLSVS